MSSLASTNTYAPSKRNSKHIFLKEIIDTVGPYIVSIINSSLVTGNILSSLKHAVVQHLLKKSNFDAVDSANYRPTVYLSCSFLSKVFRKNSI